MATTKARHRQTEDRRNKLRYAARSVGVELPSGYTARIIQEAGPAADVGVSRLGAGVVIHTVPPNRRSLPVLLGYADGRGQWHRDGTRHIEEAIGGAPVLKEGVAL